MKNKFTKINIETLILVAVWEAPFIFQGCFKIRKEDDAVNSSLLFFRCEGYHLHQTAIVNEFSPNEYIFTHLYRNSVRLSLENSELEDKHALYLLKYALDLTLKSMLEKQKQDLIYRDEVVTETIAAKIAPILHYGSWSDKVEDIGFAVAVDFNPQETMGEAAVLALLAETKSLHAKIN
ncbi:hypothetical protein [Legionella cardiaca]|uniref:Uncharacterized protein n=1 Tax=Legionella cardiaca TaxID=1071983 RepID=A0ABY8AV08_9GAMM|nr:hypothetical protein [Legionella cardiaca]WED43236.1 hypothetical protein PXX05_00220 [Legionella cardiaca]